MVPEPQGHIDRRFQSKQQGYCIHCKEEWNFAEVRPFGDYNYEDFLVEFRKGNFDNEGNRILPYRQFFAELREKEELDNE